MAPTALNRLVLVMTSLVLIAGVVDGIISHEWDLLAVFVAALALQLLLLARLSSRRPAVPIRGDLVAWLRQQAALGGEPMEAVADRAIAAHRAGFSDLPGSTSPTTRRNRPRRHAPPPDPSPQDPGP